MEINNPYRSYGSPEDRAKSLLTHYLQVAKGEALDDDCVAEIGNIIDCILQAVERRSLEHKLKQERQSREFYERRSRELADMLEKVNSVIIDCLGDVPESVVEKLDPISDEIGGYFAD
jgi:RNAse (barnase) inhibitor barstar